MTTNPESVGKWTADAIVSALVEGSRADLAKARLADIERPVGTLAVDIDFYSRAEKDKPHEDYDFHAHGHHYQGSGARWCAIKVKWTGSEWKRVRRLTGPMQFSDALSKRSEFALRLGLGVRS